MFTRPSGTEMRRSRRDLSIWPFRSASGRLQKIRSATCKGKPTPEGEERRTCNFFHSVLPASPVDSASVCVVLGCGDASSAARSLHLAIQKCLRSTSKIKVRYMQGETKPSGRGTTRLKHLGTLRSRNGKIRCLQFLLLGGSL